MTMICSAIENIKTSHKSNILKSNALLAKTIKLVKLINIL